MFVFFLVNVTQSKSRAHLSPKNIKLCVKISERCFFVVALIANNDRAQKLPDSFPDFCAEYMPLELGELPDRHIGVLDHFFTALADQ